MRRSALAVLIATAVFAASCSSDSTSPTPAGPSQPEENPSASLNLRCRDNGLISIQLARILPAGAPDRLLAKGLAKFALVEVALLLRKQQLAQTRALDLIAFLVQNRSKLINATSALTATRLGNVIDAILCLVGLSPTGVPLTPNTVVAVVPADNPEPVIIRSLVGDVGANVPAHGTPTTDVNGKPIAGVVLTLTSNVGPLNTPLDKYGQAIDLTASEEVLWLQGGVTVALCVTAEEALFERLRVGHEGGVLPKFGAIEILPPGETAVIDNILETCSASAPPVLTTGQGGMAVLKELATRFFLPDPLYASMATTTVGVGGLAGKFSKFQVVDPRLEVLADPAKPASTAGAAGEPVAQPPSVLVRTTGENTATPGDHTVVPGIQIKFNVTSGTGSSIVPADPAFVETDATGVATATSWTIVAGVNTATAAAVPPVTEITFTPTTLTFTATGTNSPAGVISNGTISLGVNQTGNLIVNSGGLVGLRLGTAEALAVGTLTEGWGVARPGTGSTVTGYANVAQGAPVGLTIESFSGTSENAKSVVRIGSTYRVTHDFKPQSTNLYEVGITIENLSGEFLSDVVYRRVMDWDIPPTEFQEFVSVRGTSSPLGVSASNNGPGASANPLTVPPGGTGGDFTGDFSTGPADQGAVFNLKFNLAAGATKTFVLYYGAAANTEAAKAVALSADVEVLSLARPNPEIEEHADGSPNTFIAAFSGLGVPVLTPSATEGMLRLTAPSLRLSRPSGQAPQQVK